MQPMQPLLQPSAAAAEAPRQPTLAAARSRSAACPLTGRLTSRLAAWWHALWLDPMSAYLSQAADHVDLERRLSAWEAYEHRHRVRWW